MASFRKRKGSWEVSVAKGGIRKSASFSTKAEASAWATGVEAEILSGKRGEVPDKTFGDLLERYRDEVSPTKRGERWERLRIGLTLRDEVARVKLRDFDARAVAGWRDRRLAQVSAASVQREWNLLSNACTVAVREWKWLRKNPMREVRRPPPTESRNRLATDGEIERLLFALGYDYDTQPETVTARVGAAMLFAIETAMRAGEIAGLAWANVKLEQRYCKTSGKTAAARRDVPLSAEAIRIIEQMRGGHHFAGAGKVMVFNLTAAQIDALFRKAKARAMIDDLHFHDMRHLAITRLAKKLDVLALARMVGHKDLRMLMIYYNESAENMSARLA